MALVSEGCYLISLGLRGCWWRYLGLNQPLYSSAMAWCTMRVERQCLIPFVALVVACPESCVRPS